MRTAGKQGVRRRRRNDEIREAGSPRGLGLSRHGPRVGHQGARGRRRRLLRGAAGLRRLLLGRLDVGQPGPLRTGHDGHPDRQREQQLLHRVRRRCSLPHRRFAADWPTARSRSASRRCSPARCRAAPRTASHPWAVTSRRWPRSTSSHSRWRRGCSPRRAASTCANTAPPQSISRRSATRTISTR